MIDSSTIDINLYDYELPDENIPRYPLAERSDSNLLVYKNGAISHVKFSSITNILTPGTMLVFNNTKVIQARMEFRKETGARIEIFCLEPFEPAEYVLAFEKKETCTWKCIVGNKKKWKHGKLSMPLTGLGDASLQAEMIRHDGETALIQFTWTADLCFGEILEHLGTIPIPPYLNRESEDTDLHNYQTVYSKIKGSVAAPTAGLHFTDRILGELDLKGFKRAELTLHVGAGTFKPVKGSVADHTMHTEHFYITSHGIDQIINGIDHITAVGTTSVRILESLFRMGVKLIEGDKNFACIKQWEVYNETNIQVEDALMAIKQYMSENGISILNGSTDIMIVPGYKFKLVKNLITNFHQPKSTLLLLVSALIGDRWAAVYKYARENGFRFLSYGDSSILIP